MAMSLSAEEKSDYKESFDSGTACPKGWMYNVSSTWSAGSLDVDDNGRTGKCLKAVQGGQTIYSGNYYYNSLLTTPKMLSATATFWVKPVSGSSESTLTVYSLDNNTEVPGYYSIQKATVSGFDASNSDWQQVTVSGVTSGKYLGIRGHNVYIDDFAADKVDFVLRKHATLSVSNKTPQVSSASVIYADADGKGDMKYEVSLTNDGDVDFTGDFTATLKDKAGNVFDTKTIPGPLVAGASKTELLEMRGPVIPSGDWLTYYTMTVENAGFDAPMEYSSPFSFHIYPYEPIFCLMANEDDDSQIRHNAYDWNKPNLIDAPYIVKEGRSLWLYNSAKAPMVVNAVSCTDGFSIDVQAPFSVNGGEKKKLTFSYTGSAPGAYYGEVTFTEQTLGEVKYALTSLVAPEGKFTADFEDESIPTGWVNNGNYWKLSSSVESLKVGGSTQYLECTQGTSYPGVIITPQLSFTADESVTFLAAKYSNSAEIKVMYSADRATWTDLASIRGSYNYNADNWKNECHSSAGEWRPFSFKMPEGNYYLAFQAGYGRIDNICGGERIDKAHDILHVAHALPVKGNVNARYLAKYQGTNLLPQAETGYRVVLEFDGVAVADGVHEVESPEDSAEPADTPDEWKPGETATYNFSYVPHTDGTFNVTISLLSGDDREVLASGTAVIDIERDMMDLQVGDPRIFTLAPIEFGKKISQSEILYTADMLQMEAGTRITAMTFETACGKTIKKHVKIYAANTDKTGYPTGYYDEKKGEAWENLTLLYDHVITLEPHGNEADRVTAQVMKFDFDTPIVYDGRTLLVQICMNDVEGSDPTARPYMSVDNSPYLNTTAGGNMFIHRETDTAMSDNLEDWWDIDTEQGDLVNGLTWYRYSTGYPVTYFSTAKDVVNLSGTVKDELGAAVEGAAVNLRSANYLYNATTDAQGYYKLNVMQLKEPYDLTVESEGYLPQEEKDMTFSSEQLAMTRDFTLEYADKTVAVTGTVTLVSDSSDDYPKPGAGAVVTFSAEGVDAVTATADASGIYSLAAPRFGLEYTVKAVCDGAESVEKKVLLDGKAAEVNLELEAIYDGVLLISTDGSDAEYFTLQGIKVKSVVPGQVYIRRQDSKTTKVMVR